MLRGIPADQVWGESFRGAYGLPPLAQMMIDVGAYELLDFLRASLSEAFVEGQQHRTRAGTTDWQSLLSERQLMCEESPHTRRVFLIFSDAGATGNACGQTLPYLIWRAIKDLGLKSIELVAVVLGPYAYRGLTQYTEANHKALRWTLDELRKHGMGRRAFRRGLEIDCGTRPPYQRFLLKPGAGPRAGEKVSDAELRAFYDRAALDLHASLRRQTWDTALAQLANVDLQLHERHNIHLVRGSEAAGDATTLHTVLATRVEKLAYEVYLGEHSE